MTSPPRRSVSGADLAVRSSGLRRGLAQAVKWYLGLNGPKRGRSRLMTWGAGLLAGTPQFARARDERAFLLQFPRDHGWEALYFLGDFEAQTTSVLRHILRAGDVTFDIGANIGWYTTLFATRCPTGHCHAFEPQPDIFEELAANCALNRVAQNVTLNRLALADRPGSATIHRFAGLPHGHSSMSAELGQASQGHPCEVTTLDRYCADGAIGSVDLIKVDVEGAELSVLKGAESVIALTPPPIWCLEANFETSKAFGYAPADLFRFLSERNEFQFFRVNEDRGGLSPLRDFGDCEQSDNVFCVPPARVARLAGLV